MSDASTVRQIKAYFQEKEPTRFLASKFIVRPGNLHTTEDVEIDIVRSEEDVAIAIQDLSAGYHNNSNDIYTSKRFKPPIFKESGSLNGFDLIGRQPGQTPFDSPDFQANATVKAFDIFRKTERKIRRAIELQAAQVLQTGIVTLLNADGVALYTLDYKPKATHFPTAPTAWDAVGGLPLRDLEALADIIRDDGLSEADELIFGTSAWNVFINHATVKALLDNRRINLGAVAPEDRGDGAKFQGTIWIGNYQFNMWTYNGRYKHPQTGVSTKFVDRKKVIMRSTSGRMDATFGAIPRIAPPESRVMPFLPTRISDAGGGIDLFANAWLTADGEQLFAGVGARPLMIPVAIDTYGCIDSDVT